MNFSKYKKSIIACVLALGIGVGGGYYFFGNPVTHQTTVKEQTKQTKPITDTRNTYVCLLYTSVLCIHKSFLFSNFLNIKFY